MKKEILKAIKEDRLMDFIVSNSYQITKDDLATIIIELDYAIYKVVGKSDRADIIEKLHEELEERLL